MNNVGSTNALFLHFGTRSPVWFFRDDSNTLQLSGDGEITTRVVVLDQTQIAAIRRLKGVTGHLVLSLRLFDDVIKFHLVGRKIDESTWSGTAADYGDTETVARDLENGLIFAEQVVSEVNSLVVIIDSQGKIKRFNNLCEELTGLKEEDLLGKNAHDLFIPEGEHNAARSNINDFFKNGNAYQVERPVNSRHGQRRILWRNKLIESGSGEPERFLVCSGTDVTEERTAKEKLVDLATRDVLTGLLNRYAIQEFINEAIESGSTEGFGVLFLDLDNFKKVNDHYGHIVGDKLIQAAAQTIESCLGEGNMMARLGGDEFLIYSADPARRGAESLAQRILEKLYLPFSFDRAEIYSSCSIGISMFPEHGKDIEQLVRSADVAMYAAKDGGRNTYRFFSSDMDRKVGEYVWLDTNLRKALSENQLELHYQPKQSLTSGEVKSVEALVRWNSPERGAIGPDQFIPYAEDCGLIKEIGFWVMEAAVAQAVEWKRKGITLRIAINVSARQLQRPTLVRDFKELLMKADILPSVIDIELTESCLVDDEEFALKLIAEFKALGSEVHLDDFGTGYSSLSQLSRMPLDVLKLDRSFIHCIDTDIKAQRLLRSIVAVAQELHMKVVAEGIESPSQFEFLTSIGVDYGQGYLFGRPMSADVFEKWYLRTQKEKANF
ncbi:cyclic di-GMP phosphodiesterase [Undibacterium sp. SXout20W]|uniref:cyclic di-GMP phosphodiesterase n=1 Tax=Undibacterium sp. SXout20W TaxID=3413051 RepID=UPI003BF3AA19